MPDSYEGFHAADHDRLIRVEETVRSMQKALELQAKEYERRLDSLNHVREHAEETARTFVTQENYAKALKRVDERFDEFVKRYEERHEQIQRVLSSREGAIAQAEATSMRAARFTSTVVGIVGLLLTLIILIANHVL